MQEITIDFDALDNSYIEGIEFAFFTSLKHIDPFQPHLTQNEIDDLMGAPIGSCGFNGWSLNEVAAQINKYWQADDECDGSCGGHQENLGTGCITYRAD